MRGVQATGDEIAALPMKPPKDTWPVKPPPVRPRARPNEATSRRIVLRDSAAARTRSAHPTGRGAWCAGRVTW